VVTDIVDPAWMALADHSLTFEQAATTIDGAAATLQGLAAAEPHPEARRDIERLARAAARDGRAVRRQDVSGGGDFKLAQLIIKWQNRGFGWCQP
jgi:hypothetical protein